MWLIANTANGLWTYYGLTIAFADSAFSQKACPPRIGAQCQGDDGGTVTAKIPTAANGQRIERRSPRPPDQLPIDELQRMPALVVLERLPAPALAVDRVGTILFANGSFCDMVGYPSDELLSMNFEDIFYRRAGR